MPEPRLTAIIGKAVGRIMKKEYGPTWPSNQDACKELLRALITGMTTTAASYFCHTHGRTVLLEIVGEAFDEAREYVGTHVDACACPPGSN